MSRTAFVFLLAVLSGCAALDWAAGVDEKGQDKPGPSPIERTSPLADAILPGLGGLLLLAGNAYAAWRAKRWKDAAIATFETIEHGAQVGQAVAELKKDLAKVHEKVGVYGLVNKVVSKFGKDA